MTCIVTPILNAHGKPSAIATGVQILRRTENGWIGFASADEAFGHPSSNGPVSTMETRYVR